MFMTKRQSSILDLLKNNGQVLVDELVDKFGVTPQTIRTDLNDLSKANKIVRVHGGARLMAGRENVEYEARRQIAASQKVLIGRAASKIIPDNASLFINIGTTTEAFSDALIDHKGLMVITNNINVASRLRLFRDNEVIITGGVVRPSDGGIVGEAAVDFIGNFKVDYAIIGSSAIDSDGSLLDFDFREVKVAQAIIKNARHVILLADSTKLGRSAPVRIGHISQVNTFITDIIDDDDFREVCINAEIRVIEVQV
ncbi:MAG: DeoR family glycerol-3-phosphate regulon repressor [Polaribacter sp.]